MLCPFCQEENLDGADVCEHCQEPLTTNQCRRSISELEKRLLRDQIASLDPRPAIVVEHDTPLGEVLQLLVANSIGCVVVCREDRLAGIFTERDVLLKVNTAAAELAAEPISKFMTASAATIDLDAEIAYALHKMDVGGYRHLPVMAGDQVCGVISIRDIMRFVTENLSAVD